MFPSDAADARLVVEAGISPPASPGEEEEEEEVDEVRDHIVVKGEDPLEADEALTASLRVKSPSDINHQNTRKRLNSSSHSDSGRNCSWYLVRSFIQSYFSLASKEISEL